MKMDGQIRVKTDARHSRLYNDLKGVAVGDFHELFFLCACLGYKYKKRISLSKAGEDRFWSNTINANEWASYYAMILEQNEMDFIAVQDDKIVLKTIEEYANGGMAILLEEFLNDYVTNTKEGPQLEPGYNKELPKNFLHFIFERIDEIDGENS